MRPQHLLSLAADEWGLHMPGAVDFVSPQFARSFAGAMDAQPALVTASNSGIPAFLTTLLDPTLIQVVTAPMKAAQVLGEAKKGNWVTETALFPVIENTGEVSTYGDYSANGSSGANVNWVNRQSYHYQTMTQWGEKELERMGEARIGWAAALNVSSALTLNKYQNQTYLFGVAGLLNFGLLNDPSLPAPIQPGPKAYNTQAHGPWITAGVVTATPNEVFTDIQSLYVQLITQTDGVVQMDSAMKLVLPPSSAVALTSTNNFGVTVEDLLKKNFPNLSIETVPEYATAAGNVMQLIGTNVMDGQDTGTCAFTEKMRAHPIVVANSAFSQKKSQGTWGAIITQPLAIAQMLGI